MKAVLVDSDILIEVFRARDHGILSRWEELSKAEAIALCSPVSIAELWRGVLPHEVAALTDLLASMTCIPITLRHASPRNMLRRNQAFDFLPCNIIMHIWPVVWRRMDCAGESSACLSMAPVTGPMERYGEGSF